MYKFLGLTLRLQRHQRTRRPLICLNFARPCCKMESYTKNDFLVRQESQVLSKKYYRRVEHR